MISSLTLQDFQSHKYSTFAFDKGLNVIVGKSHEGKSSVVRALSLILYNNWDKSWVRYGCSHCVITLILDNGTTVTRQKGEKINKYILKIENTEQEFTNFGVDVPEVIQKALGVSKIQLDKDDFLTLNLSSQLDSLFMFNRSGSQKAKVFGKLSGAHYLDHALRSLATEKKQNSVELNLKAKELEELETQHSTLNEISAFQSKIEELEFKNNMLDGSRNRVDTLKSLFLRVQDFKARYTSESNKESILAQAKQVETASLETSLQRLNTLKQLKNRQNDILNKENTLNNTKNQLNQQFESETQEYLQLLRENSICPTCFETLNEQKMSKIHENLTGEHKCLA